ncbi:MAG: disulfide bond formation protein DsbA [Anaerolineae bacterium]|nr:DsbA family protein [Anaerolineales bacterium]MCQ3977789.1 disulfide bond formation protein DsbA [Anaerolineae bacterium]
MSVEKDKELQTQSNSNKQNSVRRWLAWGGVALVLLLLGVAAWPRLNSDGQSASSAAEAFMTDYPSLGPETAPVIIVEYGDLGCPACWAWHKLGVLKDIRAKYGDQVRFVWKDFPVITLDSPKAAEAAQCAHEQGKFWEFHDAIYDSDNPEAIGKNDLNAYAAKIGLDMDQFNTCVDTRRYQDKVNNQQQEAFEIGFTGTPAFLVNDQPFVGVQRFEVFEKVIDSLLAPER